MKKKPKSCDYKIRYSSREEAEEVLRQHRVRRLLVYRQPLFTSMMSYRCEIHDCYHLGHNRFKSRNKVSKSMLGL